MNTYFNCESCNKYFKENQLLRVCTFHRGLFTKLQYEEYELLCENCLKKKQKVKL